MPVIVLIFRQAEKLLREDGGQKARVLSGKISAAIPRFEATEEVWLFGRIHLFPMLIIHIRNARVESTDKRASSNLNNARNLTSHFMRAELVESE